MVGFVIHEAGSVKSNSLAEISPTNVACHGQGLFKLSSVGVEEIFDIVLHV